MTDTTDPGALVDTTYVRVMRGTPYIYFRLPDGKVLRLTPKQAATAIISDHGNATWSKLRFTVEMEADIAGNTVEEVRERLVSQLHAALEEKDKEIFRLSNALHEVKDPIR